MTNQFISIGMVVFLLVVMLIAFHFGYQSYNADKFCRDNGHDLGRYKALSGGYYSCSDFTRYNLNGVIKTDGKN